MTWPEIALAILGGLLGYWWDHRDDDAGELEPGRWEALPLAPQYVPLRAHGRRRMGDDFTPET